MVKASWSVLGSLPPTYKKTDGRIKLVGASKGDMKMWWKKVLWGQTTGRSTWGANIFTCKCDWKYINKWEREQKGEMKETEERVILLHETAGTWQIFGIAAKNSKNGFVDTSWNPVLTFFNCCFCHPCGYLKFSLFILMALPQQLCHLMMKAAVSIQKQANFSFFLKKGT